MKADDTKQGPGQLSQVGGGSFAPHCFARVAALVSEESNGNSPAGRLHDKRKGGGGRGGGRRGWRKGDGRESRFLVQSPLPRTSAILT